MPCLPVGGRRRDPSEITRSPGVRSAPGSSTKISVFSPTTRTRSGRSRRSLPSWRGSCEERLPRLRRHRPTADERSAMSSSQTWDPERYARNARVVSDLGAPVVELLAPRPGERILDLGCGDGALTQRLVAIGCDVVGVDGSAAQVAAARTRGLECRVMDGEQLAFDAAFDAVFSNAALHWMKRADDVIAGVWRALRPGGRFVGECGGHGCVATIVRALERSLAERNIDARALNPWYFPTIEDYGGRLRARGFVV